MRRAAEPASAPLVVGVSAPIVRVPSRPRSGRPRPSSAPPHARCRSGRTLSPCLISSAARNLLLNEINGLPTAGSSLRFGMRRREMTRRRISTACCGIVSDLSGSTGPSNDCDRRHQRTAGCHRSANFKSEPELFDRRRSQNDPLQSIDSAQCRRWPARTRTFNCVVQWCPN